MNIVYKEPFKPQILWEAGDKDRGNVSSIRTQKMFSPLI